MKISRQQAEEHLNAGRPVAFTPEGQPARTLQVPEGGKKATRAKLPPEDVEGEYTLLRDEKGNLTRAGMEQVMRDGGTVMLDGKIIEYHDDLPTEAELARGDERREAQVRQALDGQIAALMAQRSQLGQTEGGSETSIQQDVGRVPAGQPGPPVQVPQVPPSRPGPRPRPPVGRDTGKPGEEKKED